MPVCHVCGTEFPFTSSDQPLCSRRCIEALRALNAIPWQRGGELTVLGAVAGIARTFGRGQVNPDDLTPALHILTDVLIKAKSASADTELERFADLHNKLTDCEPGYRRRRITTDLNLSKSGYYRRVDKAKRAGLIPSTETESGSVSA